MKVVCYCLKNSVDGVSDSEPEVIFHLLDWFSVICKAGCLSIARYSCRSFDGDCLSVLVPVIWHLGAFLG
jgi:hypothetical protein